MLEWPGNEEASTDGLVMANMYTYTHVFIFICLCDESTHSSVLLYQMMITIIRDPMCTYTVQADTVLGRAATSITK